ncbi:MFS transporter [Dyadobacter psychrophilus]|uniref:MFS transporter, DHA3 family, multidrug efflux protein n=1 Tax=Dyadobacter psychrophilus TaxID=651661 RepID=A0A1T5ELW4_9BACT|nr:MFS transporter [Dyadobacter psychrophilus]SKB84947.1 MFS transporter, DHA3 family, multidrug efflux protein [Dyadobacter psychrophilus]
MKTFYSILVNSLAATLTNTFVWFAVTFWVYLETKSVIATSVMAGIYFATVALSGFFLGSIVDRYKKKTSMMISGIATLVLYVLAFLTYVITPEADFKNPANISLWILIVLCLLGAMVGNIRAIAISTVVTILIEEDKRDKANGLVGTVNGVSFLVASIFSGLVIGFMGMTWMLGLAVALTVAVLLHLFTIHIPEKEIVQTGTHMENIDIKGTIAVVGLVPGLFGLIFFNTFNNFLGGVFMSLMDAYGLSLVSVQVWGILWGVLSLGFIVGGLVVARKGLGKKPLKTLFVSNIIMWTICIFFTIQASIVLLAVGMFIYLCLIPVVEATEQTILQKVIPHERQGRVFGFAQSIEQAASPITAFMIGPIAKFIFIPFMTTGAGVELIGSWFGTGTARGLALLFTVTGVIGLIVTLIAMQSKAYHKLSQIYKKPEPAFTEADAIQAEGDI